jgi:hypothetical protein
MGPNVEKAVIYLTENVVSEYSNRHDIPFIQCYEKFITSNTFKLLCNEKTAMWTEGMVHVYHEFENELQKK